VRLPAFLARFRGLSSDGQERKVARWQVLLLLSSAAAGLLELGLHVRFSRAAPGLEEWEALRPAVERLASEGTLVVVAPRWAEPNARHALGDRLMPLAHVARADDSSFERALEISILGQSAAELEGWQLESEQDSGRFRLRRFRNPSAERILYDFLEHVEPPALGVALERDGVSSDCRFGGARITNGDLHGHPTFPSPRFLCSKRDEWQFVGRTVIEDQNYEPRRCIWAHPPTSGALRLRFEAVPIGQKLIGHAGMPYFFERETPGADVQLEVRVGDEVVGNYTHADGEGWKPFEFSTSRFAGSQQAVEFRVSSANAWRREFCLQAESR
jgi:hypothetical protein